MDSGSNLTRWSMGDDDDDDDDKPPPMTEPEPVMNAQSNEKIEEIAKGQMNGDEQHEHVKTEENVELVELENVKVEEEFKDTKQLVHHAAQLNEINETN